MKCAFIFTHWAAGANGLDFNNPFTGTRQLSGSDLGIIIVAKEFVKLGHDVSLYCSFANPNDRPASWEGVKLFDITNINKENTENYDVLISWSDPNVFPGLSDKPCRIVYQMLNDFSYATPGFDQYVDQWITVCEELKQHLIKQPSSPRPEKWQIVPLGCEPSWYKDIREPGRVVWTSSPDRGLHWLLNCWPTIKAAVPYADLRIFYNFNYSSTEGMEPTSNNHPHFLEMGHRARYMKDSIKRLEHLGVLQLGAINRERMQYELSAASVFAFPCDTIAFTEGFSISTLEAHASYTVPVITDQDCLGSIYNNSGAVVIKSPIRERLSEFSSAVIKSLTDKKFADATIEKCMAFANEHTWAKTTQKLEKIMLDYKKPHQNIASLNKSVKLNLGSGISGLKALDIITMVPVGVKNNQMLYTNDQSGWKNIDMCADYNPHECYDLSQGIKEEDNSIEEIWMGDFFEHLLRIKSEFVIKECFRVLKPGGRLRMSLPDMAIVMPLWLKEDEKQSEYSQLIFGDQDELYQKNSIPSAHFHGYTENSLKKMLSSVGFKDIKRIGIHKNWCELAIEAYK
jgi:glycosyltransferase involved in cell wall biosynthesis